MTHTRGNKLVAVILVACMSIALFLGMPINPADVLADELPSLSNVQLVDGVLSWDALDGATNYSLYFYNETHTTDVARSIEECSYDIKAYLVSEDCNEGTYTIQLTARAMNKYGYMVDVSQTAVVTNYEYVKPAQLATPTNLKWDGTIATWDAVPNATSYKFILHHGLSIKEETVTDNFYDCEGFMADQSKAYFEVTAYADYYPTSETAVLAHTDITYPDIQNVQISADGVVTWDAVESASEYRIIIKGSYVNYCSGSNRSFDLKSYCDGRNWDSQEVTFTLDALLSNSNGTDRVAQTYSGTYSYTAIPKLDTPTNLGWSGKVATWDAVANATSYELTLYRNSTTVKKTVTTNSCDFSDSITTETTYYYRVVAVADGYRSSDYAESAHEEFVLGELTNVKISEDGILSWDAFPGATQYSWVLGTYGGYVSDTQIDLSAICEEHGLVAGDYSVSLTADSDYIYNNGEKISQMWNGTYIYRGSDTTPTPTPETTPAPTPETPKFTGGMAHVQDVGDVNVTAPDTGAMVIGTRGMSRRLESITLNYENNTPYSGTLQYRVHVQDIGWMNWVNAGSAAGTRGQSKRIEAIEIRLTDELAQHYSVEYCVHIQDYGDNQGWVHDGALAGTTGESKRIEELKVQIVPIGTSTTTSVNYRVHVQDYGWESKYASAGAMSGTMGQSKRLEGIEIFLGGCQYSGGIRYKTHVQNIGWESSWSTSGEMSGTQGQSLRLEGIAIELTGDVANHYDIYYRVHAQDIGWLSWASNGDYAGTAGRSARLEGIQIVLVPKGAAAPGATYQGITADDSRAFVEGF
ncbi:MAG: hypothetical protein K5745_00950 [Saccharofermentans sp.]|nr:hypothetical protein [Saccharofermentans sp.]